MAVPERKQREVAARRARVLELRAAGWTFQQIADECGHATAGAAVMDVTRALSDRKSVLARQRGLLSPLEAERYDGLERELQKVLSDASAAHDYDRVLATADRLTRLWARRSRLHGLDTRNVPEQPARKADGIDQLAARRAARRSG